MSTVQPMYEWNTINWKQIQLKVFKLQKRIYQASLLKDTVKVRRLQKLMISSWYAKAMAVRKVTQDNRGKRTAGIDGVKDLPTEMRMKMVNDLQVNEKAKPVRRIWIPKPGKQEKRPLGIPTIRERARQALVKLALEPEWEARFEGNSYGFRPGRSAHDAIEAIFCGVGRMPKFIFDADIKACFDKINHIALLKKINTDCQIKRAIKSWLKAGILDGDTLFPSEEGAPQGSIVSPLLANIALHGLETTITKSFVDRKTIPNGKKMKWKPIVVRYADDFLIFHPDLEALKQASSIARDWLSGVGLEINEAKTNIKHTFNTHEGYKPGFDFLGFTVRQYKTVKNSNGIKTIITPSRKSIDKHQLSLKGVTRSKKHCHQEDLIKELNPKISGWSNYFGSVCSKETFSKMDHLMFWKLYRWARKKHPKMSRRKVVIKYWTNWKFCTRNGYRLNWHTDKKITRHTKVRGGRSPFDGDIVYWSTRLGRHPSLPRSKASALKRQNGKCAHCEQMFMPEDSIEIYHPVSLQKGGSVRSENVKAVHNHCHDKIYRQKQRGTYDRS